MLQRQERIEKVGVRFFIFVFTREAEAEAEVEARVEFHFPLHKQSTTQAHAIVMFLPESLFLSALSL